MIPLAPLDARAPVDELRALPPVLALRVLDELEEELGAEAIAALAYEAPLPEPFYRRPKQVLPELDGSWSTLVLVGEFGTGKTYAGLQAWLEILLSTRCRARLVTATGADIEGTILNGPSGLRDLDANPRGDTPRAEGDWLPPWISLRYLGSKGHQGEMWIDGLRVSCCSADAPGQALGEGAGLQLLDDIEKWIETSGASSAAKAYAACMKSLRQQPGITIIPTTPGGAAFLVDVLSGNLAGVKIVELGDAENNAGNLTTSFLAQTKTNLRALGLWSSAGTSPWARPAIRFSELRLAACPALVEIGVSVDPAKTSGPAACAFGIVGGGRDARSAIHLRYDRSAVLDDGVNGWPRAAWDLACDLQREHPGTPWHFVLESNVGKVYGALLRAEEERRRQRGEQVPLPSGGWSQGTAVLSVCDVRLVRADKDKCKRAIEPARLAEQGQVRFAHGLTELETQLRELTPTSTKSDRADAGNHLVSDLAGLGAASKPDPRDAIERSFEGFGAYLDKREREGRREGFDMERA